MTQADFDKLPLLLTRKRFQQITNLSDGDLGHAVRAGEIQPWWPRGSKGKTHCGYAKYRKVDAARIAGLKV